MSAAATSPTTPPATTTTLSSTSERDATAKTRFWMTQPGIIRSENKMAVVMKPTYTMDISIGAKLVRS